MTREIRVDELKAKIENASVFLLDVRNPEECERTKIAGSVNIPLHDLYGHLSELPHDKEIVTICAAGNRSWTAAEILEEKGFRVRSLRGGMKAWNLSLHSAESEEHAAANAAHKKGFFSRLFGG